MGDYVSYNLYVKDFTVTLKEAIGEALAAGGWGEGDATTSGDILWYGWDEVRVGSSDELAQILLGVIAQTKTEFRFSIGESGYYGAGLSTYHIPGLGERDFVDDEHAGEVIPAQSIQHLLDMDEEIRATTGVVDPTWLRRGLEELVGAAFIKAWNA